MFFRAYELPKPRPLPGTGRLGLVATYFWLWGLFGLVGVCVAAVFLVSDPAMRARMGAVWWLYVVLGIGVSLALFRTADLLRARTRMGAWLAVGTILCSWAPALHGSRVSVINFILGGLGVVLLLSVWKHLE